MQLNVLVQGWRTGRGQSWWEGSMTTNVGGGGGGGRVDEEYVYLGVLVSSVGP